MNKKYVVLGLAVLVIVGLAWVGRAVYHARYNRVTVDVYNAPVADVIKQFERQTQETILAGKGLEAKVTLAVKNLPLEEALDQLARQAGANWSKWHAVHGSERALTQLETALRERAKIEDAGWTNIAPHDLDRGPQWDSPAGGLPDRTDNVTTTESSSGMVVTRRKPVMIRLDSDDIKDGNVEAAIREQLKAAGADEATIAQAVAAAPQQTLDVDVDVRGGQGNSNVVVRAGAPHDRIRMVTRTRDGSGEVVEEIWTPERVVLELGLQPKLGDQVFSEASESVAREVAAKVKGQLTTLYVLRGSPGGFPLAGRRMREIHRVPEGGSNTVPGELPPLPDVESAVRRAEAENYTRLTPEQRVERAREKKSAKTNP